MKSQLILGRYIRYKVGAGESRGRHSYSVKVSFTCVVSKPYVVCHWQTVSRRKGKRRRRTRKRCWRGQCECGGITKPTGRLLDWW